MRGEVRSNGVGPQMSLESMKCSPRDEDYMARLSRSSIDDDPDQSISLAVESTTLSFQAASLLESTIHDSIFQCLFNPDYKFMQYSESSSTTSAKQSEVTVHSEPSVRAKAFTIPTGAVDSTLLVKEQKSPEEVGSPPWALAAPVSVSSPERPPEDAFRAPQLFSSKNLNDYDSLISQFNSYKKQLKTLENTIRRYYGEQGLQSQLQQNSEYQALVSQLSDVKALLKDAKKQQGHSKDTQLEEIGGERAVVPVAESRLTRMQLTMLESLSRLERKRDESGRASDLRLMTPDQTRQEKEDIQKELLGFEKLYGRVTAKQEKVIAKPLYDRYRTLKRLVRSSNNLDTIKTMNSDATDYDFYDNESTDRMSVATAVTDDVPITPSANELLLEKESLLERKRELRKLLNGEHRRDLVDESSEYKKIKSRLKLIEVLISKHR